MKHTFSRQHIWQQYTHAGYEAVKTLSPHSAFDVFYLASLAFGGNDPAFAAECAYVAAEKAPQHTVFQHASTYLQRVLLKEKLNVYIDGEAFAAFIRGGSNRFLYNKDQCSSSCSV